MGCIGKQNSRLADDKAGSRQERTLAHTSTRSDRYLGYSLVACDSCLSLENPLVHMATFGLTSAERDVTAPGGITTSLCADGSVKSHVTYLDFTVDGERLFSRLNNLTTDGLDFVGVTRTPGLLKLVASIERLLEEAPGTYPMAAPRFTSAPNAAT